MINYIITFFVVKYLTNFYVWTIWKQDLNKNQMLNNNIVLYVFLTLFKLHISLESGI